MVIKVKYSSLNLVISDTMAIKIKYNSYNLIICDAMLLQFVFSLTLKCDYGKSDEQFQQKKWNNNDVDDGVDRHLRVTVRYWTEIGWYLRAC